MRGSRKKGTLLFMKKQNRAVGALLLVTIKEISWKGELG